MAMELHNMNCVGLVIISVSSLILLTSSLGGAHAAANPIPRPPLAAPLPLLNPAIQKLCDATDNPKVCARSIGGQKPPVVVDLASVLGMQVNAGIRATERAITKAKRALNDPEILSQSLGESVQACLDSYDSVMESWKSALVSLKARNGFDLANHLTSVSAMAMSCEDAFTGGDPTVVSKSPLTKVDRLILKMTSNALNFQKMLFPGSN